jgi:hypothetical protein
MARVRQWLHGNQLSYLLFDPISRRSALIDPVPALEAEYQQTLQMRGMINLYLLFTSAVQGARVMAQGLDIQGSVMCPDSAVAESLLPLGEARIQCIGQSGSGRQALLCDGLLFTGSWWLPGDLRRCDTVASTALALKMPLAEFPEDYIIYPGQTVDGVRISCVGQERLLLATQEPL